MQAIIESKLNTIKYPHLLMNGELSDFAKDNSLNFVDGGSYLVFGEGTSNCVLYQKEVYGDDIIFKKA